MNNINHHSSLSEKRKLRTRKKIFGLTQRPRVSVHRTNKHIYAQVIDDQLAKTTISGSDHKLSREANKLSKTQKAEKLGLMIAQKLTEQQINQVVFDRGSFRYHGRVKAVAEALRKGGINL